MYCRLCLRSDNFLVSVFEDNSEERDKLIEECTTVVIKEDDEEFPTTVCVPCLRYVESFSVFRKQCIQNDEIIRKGQFEASTATTTVKEEQDFDCGAEFGVDVTLASNSPAPNDGPSDDEYVPDVKEETANDSRSEDGCSEDFPAEEVEVKPKKKRKPYKKREKKEKTKRKQVSNEQEDEEGGGEKKKKTQNRILKVCYICGKTTTNQTLHLIRHSDLTPYKCDYPECTKAYKTYLGLRYHKYTHTDYRPHVCEICGRGFARKSKMVVHMLVHTNERNFPCELCGKAFKQRYNLIAHRRTHTDDRKEKCLECGKCFLTRHELGKHARIHKNDEHPYKCNVCTYSTLYKASLNSHLNKVHGLNQ
ncbi:hypothetical protein DMENIID0001_079520 [Sergentomyia squamirostris]